MAKTQNFHGIKARSIEEAFSIAAANSHIAEMKAMLKDGVDIDLINGVRLN